ncbi:MAG: methyltransferase domain-containing protein [Phycisphaerae bacterium]|nr:methyltransferase domain-containing protein [Phycisphaerae bacterium]
MDAADVPQAEIDVAFRFIRRVNRWMGGTNALLRVLQRDARRWSRDRPMRWLDLGTGAADIPLAIDAWARRAGHKVECVAVEHHPACLAVARAAVGDHPRIRVIDADALALDTRSGDTNFAAHSFDYVHAGMFLHHLVDEDVIRALRAMSRLASRTIVWNDLLRTPLSRVGIYLLTIGQPSIVRDDARLSVAKGFTLQEAREFARWAGIERVTLRVSRLTGRFVLTGSPDT